jgi:hypothetical protein
MKCPPFLLALALLAGTTPPAAAQHRITVPLLPTDSLAQRIPFRGVVAVPGVTAAELQARAREWVVLTFENARQVIQLDDSARGVLIGRGYTETLIDRTLYPNDIAIPLSFAFRLDFREGRYRYEVFELGRPSPSIARGNDLATISDQLNQLTVALSSTATVGLSPRQTLFTPDTDPAHRAKSEKPNSNFSQERAAFAAGLQGTVAKLLESLRQHVAATPKKW